MEEIGSEIVGPRKNKPLLKAMNGKIEVQPEGINYK